MSTSANDTTYRVDRTGWGAGPWDDEPEDRIEWRDDATGLPCIMVRVQSHGGWCGYVAVSPGHPFHGKGYDDVRRADGEWPEVHGGLTYADACHGQVCHVLAPGGSDDVWWFGFDCVHCDDIAPGHEKHLGGLYTRDRRAYRTRDYVRAEVTGLAAQLAEVAP